MDENYAKSINRFLLDRQIKCSCKGYIYLVAAIEMGLTDFETIYYAAELYTLIAERYRTKAANVERAIRHVIIKSGQSNKRFISHAVYSIKYGEISNPDTEPKQDDTVNSTQNSTQLL